MAPLQKYSFSASSPAPSPRCARRLSGTTELRRSSLDREVPLKKLCLGDVGNALVASHLWMHQCDATPRVAMQSACHEHTVYRLPRDGGLEAIDQQEGSGLFGLFSNISLSISFSLG